MQAPKRHESDWYDRIQKCYVVKLQKSLDVYDTTSLLQGGLWE